MRFSDWFQPHRLPDTGRAPVENAAGFQVVPGRFECRHHIFVGRLVADHVKVPLVAAGGISDSRGYRAAFALGAQGVQVGTRFLASNESPAGEQWKKAIVECNDGGTDLIPSSNMRTTERIIVTPWIKQKMADPTVKNIADELDRNPAATGNYERAAFGAGQVSALIKDIKPIKAIIEDMIS